MKPAEELLGKRNVNNSGKPNYKMVRHEVNANIPWVKRTYWDNFLTRMGHEFQGGQKKISTKDRQRHFEKLFENQTFNQEKDELTDTENTTNNEWQITTDTVKTTLLKLARKHNHPNIKKRKSQFD